MRWWGSARLHVPAIVVLHTVLTSPSADQRAVLEAVVGDAAAVVVMTRTAQRRLMNGDRVEPERVVVIPHGAPTAWGGADIWPAEGAATILTWGLSARKGIEWAIQAVASLHADLAPRYVVAGETHPRALERDWTYPTG